MAYFDLSSGYHSEAAAGKPRWSHAVGNDALGKSPFCESFMVLARPPVWSVHIDEGYGRASFAVNFVDHQWIEQKLELNGRPECVCSFCVEYCTAIAANCPC